MTYQDTEDYREQLDLACFSNITSRGMNNAMSLSFCAGSLSKRLANLSARVNIVRYLWYFQDHFRFVCRYPIIIRRKVWDASNMGAYEDDEVHSGCSNFPNLTQMNVIERLPEWFCRKLRDGTYCPSPLSSFQPPSHTHITASHSLLV